MPITIRHYSPTEVDAPLKAKILEIDAKYFEGCDAPSFTNTHWHICFDETKNIAGYAGLQILKKRSGNQRYGFLSRCCVLPKYRSKGLQKKLIDKRISLAKKEKLEYIMTYTAISSVHSSNALISKKFKMWNPPRRFIGTNGFIYWKRDIKG
jgi:GNAT superfamily N-acetyltransferase